MSTTRVQLIDKNTTVGTAAAEDTKIVFDGNAQDFHIGIDDSTDSLTLGLGTALGTTTHARFDPIGAVTMPLQPCFHAHLDTTAQSNFSAASTTLEYKTERFDNNGDFNTSNYTFTAPVQGRYLICANVELVNIDNANDYMRMRMNTSNIDYYQGIMAPDKVFSSDGGYFSLHMAQIVDMDANDTCLIQLQINSGTAQTDIVGTYPNTFTGCLLA
jgi:hypothetical protein|tara:strand:+ start:282 stop:926 length:645 start_codon:yes stop_codon:yes gene_type:complete